MGMRLIISVLIVLRIFLYYYNDALIEIYSNFSLYFPFFNVTTYLDIYNVVFAPLFLRIRGTPSRAPVYLFREEELKKCNGKDSSLLYLAVLGNVFDVTNGAAYYGVGKVYHGFTGISLNIFNHFRCQPLNPSPALFACSLLQVKTEVELSSVGSSRKKVSSMMFWIYQNLIYLDFRTG